MNPLSLLRSKMALAKVLVVRLINVSVRRWRETTFVVRWSARTFVRHVAPAAAASLPSLSISAPALFVAFVDAASVAVAPAAAAAGRDGGHVGHVGLVTRCRRASTTFLVLLVILFLPRSRAPSRPVRPR